MQCELMTTEFFVKYSLLSLVALICDIYLVVWIIINHGENNL